MSEGGDNVVDIVDAQAQMFRLRLAGVSVRMIAQRFGVTERQVEAAIARVCPSVSVEMRARTFELDLARLDELLQKFYLAAREGDAQCALVALRIMERRASMLGFDSPPRLAGPIEIVEAAAPKRETSTERIARLIADIRAERPAGDKQAAGEPEEPPPAA
jgi:hypothetical protein